MVRSMIPFLDLLLFPAVPFDLPDEELFALLPPLEAEELLPFFPLFAEAPEAEDLLFVVFLLPLFAGDDCLLSFFAFDEAPADEVFELDFALLPVDDFLPPVPAFDAVFDFVVAIFSSLKSLYLKTSTGSSVLHLPHISGSPDRN